MYYKRPSRDHCRLSTIHKVDFCDYDIKPVVAYESNKSTAYVWEKILLGADQPAFQLIGRFCPRLNISAVIETGSYVQENLILP